MKTVLVVDDDLMLADYLEDALVSAGYRVCGIAADVDEAICLGKQYRPDLGVIDLRLGEHGLGTDVAKALRPCFRFGVLYATGNPEYMRQHAVHGEGCLIKPFLPETLLAALGIVDARMDGGHVPHPLPRGFFLLNPDQEMPSRRSSHWHALASC
jgi:DNA-binding response OmpR family regulator